MPPGPPRPPRRRPRGPAGPPGRSPGAAPRASRVGAAPPRPARAPAGIGPLTAAALARSPRALRAAGSAGRAAGLRHAVALGSGGWPSVVPSPPERTVLRFLPSFRFHLVSLERRRVAAQERRATWLSPSVTEEPPAGGNHRHGLRALNSVPARSDPETPLYKY